MINKITNYFNSLPEEPLVTLKDGLFMWEYIKELPEVGTLLEIGTGKGHSTRFFHLVKPEWQIFTMDNFGMFEDNPNPKRLMKKDFQQIFELTDTHNVFQIFADSRKVSWWRTPLDVLFIDGNHEYHSCLQDFVNFAPAVKKGGFIFLHDYWNDEMGVRAVVDRMMREHPKAFKLINSSRMAALKVL